MVGNSLNSSLFNLSHTKSLKMKEYENSKTARRVASIAYLLIMTFILGGTYLSNQKKAEAKKEQAEASAVTELPK
jgi:type II secretory pathway component PulL